MALAFRQGVISREDYLYFKQGLYLGNMTILMPMNLILCVNDKNQNTNMQDFCVPQDISDKLFNHGHYCFTST